MLDDRHEAATADEPMTVAERRQRRARAVQIALGCLWILDAALQFQPRMFGSGLVDDMMLPMAHGQPALVAWSITNLAHVVRPEASVWNFFFGSLQICIGVGMLFRRTVRPAIVAMALWAFGVWWFGEGFGMLLTGSASPLTGAPGAVVLYPLIGLLVWPAKDRTGAQIAPGIASSAAATGPLGSGAPLFAWSGFWALSAVLWLFPDNRASGAIGAQLTAAASGQPSWYAHFETSVANTLPHSGAALAWLLAVASLVIAVGPLLSHRPRRYLLAGVAIQALFWITGMGFGGILTGMGTDPNVAPLVALLAFSLAPTVPGVAARAPGRILFQRHPIAGATTSVVTLAVLAVTSTYPVAAASLSASGSAASSGAVSMAGMAMGGRTSSAAHTARGHLDMPGMNGQADPNWRYTGPPLPAAEVSVLTTVFADTEKGHAMQTPNCTRGPTGAQTEAAMSLVQTTSAAVAKYKDLSAAVAAGYSPITDTRYPVVHYLNASYMRSKDVLDPNHVQSLVYAFTPYGPVLVAAMYLMPSVGDRGPMPGGCLTQWHAHTNLCTGGPSGLISGFQTRGVCPSGEHPLMTPEMLHVWQVPVPGGPLTMDPTDEQVVEAAIMAQQDGQAPVTPGTPPPSISGSFGT